MDTELIEGRTRVQLEDIGEGWSGDYNPEDPDDTPLMRFTVSELRNGEWEQVDDASYCTQIPATTDQGALDRLTKVIMAEVREPLESGASIKKLCERLSWLDATESED